MERFLKIAEKNQYILRYADIYICELGKIETSIFINSLLKFMEKDQKAIQYMDTFVNKLGEIEGMVDLILEKYESLTVLIDSKKFIDMERLKKFPNAIKYFPKENQTQKIVNFIKENHKNLMDYLHPKFREPNFFRKYPFAIKAVDFADQNLEMVTAAFSKNCDVVQLVAPRLRTVEMKKYSLWLLEKRSQDLNHLMGTIMTGKEFNDLFRNSRFKFVKLVRYEELHNGLQIKEGLNVDPNPFDPDCICCPGGIYFIEMDKIDVWKCKNMSVRKVTIPNNAIVKFEYDKIKTTSIFIENE